MSISKLQVLEAHQFPKSCFIKVRVLEGSYKLGPYEIMNTESPRQVNVLGRPFLVTGSNPIHTDVFTLDIELPEYPLEELVGSVLVSYDS